MIKMPHSLLKAVLCLWLLTMNFAMAQTALDGEWSGSLLYVSCNENRSLLRTELSLKITANRISGTIAYYTSYHTIPNLSEPLFVYPVSGNLKNEEIILRYNTNQEVRNVRRAGGYHMRGAKTLFLQYSLMDGNETLQGSYKSFFCGSGRLTLIRKDVAAIKAAQNSDSVLNALRLAQQPQNVVNEVPNDINTNYRIQQTLNGFTHCKDIEAAAIDLIPKFYKLNQQDSIKLLLDYAAYYCNESAPLRLTRILFLIEQHKFIDTLLHQKDITHIRKDVKLLRKRIFEFSTFPNVLEGNPENNFMFNHLLNYNYLNIYKGDYIEMLRNWSFALSKQTGNSPLEKAVLNQYVSATNGKSLIPIWWFNAKKYNYQTFSTLYEQHHKSYSLVRGIIIGMGYGNFLPTGALFNRTGNQGLWGMTMGKHIGSGTNKIQANLLMPTGRLPQPFTVVRTDTTFTSENNYMAIGQIEYGYSVWRPNRFFETHIVAGLQLVDKDIYAEPSEENRASTGVSLGYLTEKMGKRDTKSFGISLGLDTRFFISEHIAIASQLRYNAFDLGVVGGADFRGNAITANVGLHFMTTSKANRSY